MKLLTTKQRAQLLENGRRQNAVRGTENEINFEPVVKLFTPDANCTWLLTELDPDAPDIAFGLCDLGIGFPEIGNVGLSELETIRGCFGLCVERDRHFEADKTLLEYAKAARKAEYIQA